jgi:hypothetical protein
VSASHFAVARHSTRLPRLPHAATLRTFFPSTRPTRRSGRTVQATPWVVFSSSRRGSRDQPCAVTGAMFGRATFIWSGCQDVNIFVPRGARRPLSIHIQFPLHRAYPLQFSHASQSTRVRAEVENCAGAGRPVRLGGVAAPSLTRFSYADPIKRPMLPHNKPVQVGATLYWSRFSGRRETPRLAKEICQTK